MATQKQIETIKRNLAVLGEEYNPNIETLNHTEISDYIRSLFERVNVVARTRPTMGQIKMVEDMMGCPLLKYEILELKEVPKRWVQEKENLCDFIIEAEKFLANPTKSEAVAKIEGDAYECTLDYLVENAHISMEEYTSALWCETNEIVKYTLDKMKVLGLEIRENYIYRTVKQPTMKLEMEVAKAKVRIAKANQVIENYEFNIEKCDKVHISDWIEANKPVYMEWLKDRATDAQVELIKELIRRINSDVYSTRMINEEGVELKGKRWLHYHECAELSDDVIRGMSRKGANKFIRQLQLEAENPILKFVTNDERYEETRVERIRLAGATGMKQSERALEQIFMDDFRELSAMMDDMLREETSKEEVFNAMKNLLENHSGLDIIKGCF